MENFIQFITENIGVLSPMVATIVGMIIGVFLPVELFEKIGVKIRRSGKIPPYILEIIFKRVDALEKGYLSADFRGDKTIIGNHQVSEGIKMFKKDLTRIDLGLEE